ncbi:MAG: hypothetical protein AAF388_01935 [Bacteroidota bacterium]
MRKALKVVGILIAVGILIYLVYEARRKANERNSRLNRVLGKIEGTSGLFSEKAEELADMKRKLSSIENSLTVVHSKPEEDEAAEPGEIES